MNGSPPQLLRASKGLRQKDPLPPLLFTIVAKALRALSMKAEDFGLKGVFNVGQSEAAIILLFIYDTILVNSVREGVSILFF